MPFSRPEFAVFLLAVLAACQLLRAGGPRKVMLLVSSWYFYAWWDWRALGLLAGYSLATWGAGRAVASARTPEARRAWVAAHAGAGLVVLSLFKYAGFFAAQANALLQPLGIHLGTLGWALPIGISFFTFEAISYVVDLERGDLREPASLMDVSLFLAIFPHLIAGPILRAPDTIPQFSAPRPLDAARALEGVVQIATGLAKKVLLADGVAGFVDEAFANTGSYSGGTLALAVLAYAVQIYGDFSGYSDMGIGAARLLGLDFPENFDFPYVARSPSEFWRRWHVSLSSWLRDYLYIPLGGNRGTPLRTQGNLLLTMLLGGLWHGAAWTFVIWGGLHGLALASQRRLEWMRGRLGPASPWAGWMATQLVVLAGWVLFRSTSLPAAGGVLARIATGAHGIAWHPPIVLAAIGVVALTHALKAARLEAWLAIPREAWWSPFAVALLFATCVAFHPGDFHPFIYFQF